LRSEAGRVPEIRRGGWGLGDVWGMHLSETVQRWAAYGRGRWWLACVVGGRRVVWVVVVEGGWGGTEDGESEDGPAHGLPVRPADASGSSTRDVSPVGRVWRLTAWGGVVRSDTLPNVNALALRIPDPALRVQGPVDVELPDASCVADETGHGGGDGWETRMPGKTGRAESASERRRGWQNGSESEGGEYKGPGGYGAFFIGKSWLPGDL